jgi:hypothetical protein
MQRLPLIPYQLPLDIIDIGLGLIGIVRSQGATIVQLSAEGSIALCCELPLPLSSRLFNTSSVQEVRKAGDCFERLSFRRSVYNEASPCHRDDRGVERRE